MELKTGGVQDHKSLNVSASLDEDYTSDTSSFFGRFVSELSYSDVFDRLCSTVIIGVTGYVLGDQKGCGKIGAAIGTTVGTLCATRISTMPFHMTGTSLLATAAFILPIPGTQPMDKLSLAAVATATTLCYFKEYCRKNENASQSTNSAEQ